MSGMPSKTWSRREIAYPPWAVLRLGHAVLRLLHELLLGRRPLHCQLLELRVAVPELRDLVLEPQGPEEHRRTERGEEEELKRIPTRHRADE